MGEHPHRRRGVNFGSYFFIFLKKCIGSRDCFGRPKNLFFAIKRAISIRFFFLKWT